MGIFFLILALICFGLRFYISSNKNFIYNVNQKISASKIVFTKEKLTRQLTSFAVFFCILSLFSYVCFSGSSSKELSSDKVNEQQVVAEKSSGDIEKEKGQKLFISAFNGTPFYMSKDEDKYAICWYMKNEFRKDPGVKWILVDNTSIDHIWTKWEAQGDRFTMYVYSGYINDTTIEVVHNYRGNNYKTIEKWFFKKPDKTECQIE